MTLHDDTKRSWANLLDNRGYMVELEYIEDPNDSLMRYDVYARKPDHEIIVEIGGLNGHQDRIWSILEQYDCLIWATHSGDKSIAFGDTPGWLLPLEVDMLDTSEISERSQDRRHRSWLYDSDHDTPMTGDGRENLNEDRI